MEVKELYMKKKRYMGLFAILFSVSLGILLLYMATRYADVLIGFFVSLLVTLHYLQLARTIDILIDVNKANKDG